MRPGEMSCRRAEQSRADMMTGQEQPAALPVPPTCLSGAVHENKLLLPLSTRSAGKIDREYHLSFLNHSSESQHRTALTRGEKEELGAPPLRTRPAAARSS